MVPTLKPLERSSKVIGRTPVKYVRLEILEFVTHGLGNKEIANRFGISTDAIKQHLNAICTKLGAANRAEAVAIALRRQLLRV